MLSKPAKEREESNTIRTTKRLQREVEDAKILLRVASSNPNVNAKESTKLYIWLVVLATSLYSISLLSPPRLGLHHE
jgi:hypothetical protein